MGCAITRRTKTAPSLRDWPAYAVLMPESAPEHGFTSLEGLFPGLSAEEDGRLDASHTRYAALIARECMNGSARSRRATQCFAH